SEPRVLGLVGCQHVAGERAQETGHPPAQAGWPATLPADGEGLAVLQDARGQLVRGGDPRSPDDRELHLDHRPGPPQPLDAGGGIAHEVLAVDIHVHGHGSCNMGCAAPRSHMHSRSNIGRVAPLTLLWAYSWSGTKSAGITSR